MTTHTMSPPMVAGAAQFVQLELLRPLRPLDQHERQSKGSTWKRLAFLLVVVVPTLCATFYFGFVAADQFASETRFVVRSPHHNVAGFLSGFLQSTGFVRAQDDSYSVTEFIRSRAAVDELVQHAHLRDIYARPEADVLARFPPFWSSASGEALYRHYLRSIKTSTDSSSGITTLETRAFRARDAQALARALLEGAEALVNRLNDRARRDAIRYAQTEVADGSVRLTKVQQRVTSFRNAVSMVDPASQSTAMLDLVAKLMSEVADSKARLRELLREAPLSPQIKALRARIGATEEQMRAERARVVGGDTSIAPRIAEFEQLLLERDIATRMLASATTSLENAKLDAQRQQLYIERIVEPHLPDHAIYPQSIFAVLLTLALALACFVIVQVLSAHIFEREPC